MEEGKEFDALLVDVNVPGGPFDIFDGDTMEDQFEKFINLGDDRNIVEVYVQVHGRRASRSIKAGPLKARLLDQCHLSILGSSHLYRSPFRLLRQGALVKSGDVFAGDRFLVIDREGLMAGTEPGP